MDGKYIYGIMDSSNEEALGIAGLGGEGHVYTMSYRGVGCVLSDYSGAEFSSMSKEKVVRCLLAHQLVVEQAMKDHTVLPVKFGTVLATTGEVQRLLSQGHSHFVQALAWMADKVEVEVAATWDTGQVLREISQEEDIARAREAIAGRAGQTTFEERIRLGQMVKASLDRRRDGYRERMVAFLKPAAVDVQPNPLVSDEMVMNVAFLVEKDRQEEFDSRVRQLNGLFQDQVKFCIVGPLPPYSFATVEVTRLNSEKVDQARQLLGLGRAVSEPEVRKAYHRLAAAAHPDRRPGDELAKRRFIELRQAFDLLIACCRGQGSEGSLLVNLKRQGEEDVQHLRFVEIGNVVRAANG